METEEPQQIEEQKQETNDGGREARISLRKARIEQARLAKNKPSNLDGNVRRVKKIEPEMKNQGRSKGQVENSTKQIDQIRSSGSELVSNIKVGVTGREMLQRQDQASKIDIWRKKRVEETNLSSSLCENIDKEWDSILKVASPYKLDDLLNKQKDACAQVLQVKNKLIAEYVAELKQKDDEYVRELKRQAEEIDQLLSRMDGQYTKYQSTLISELEQIERAFVEERQDLIASNLKELEGLFEMRRQNESKYMRERADRIDEHSKQLEALRIHDAEEYNLVKIKLETDVQILEQQLEQMHATYQLNTEKLDYNHQVLKKREEENGTILGAQKRKINRLNAAKQERQFDQENISLTEDYKHLEEQYKKKFRHFKYIDNKKFKEIWAMNEEEAKELMRKLLSADRIIYEQQLGLEWQGPKEDLFRKIDPDFFRQEEKISPEEHYEQTLEKKIANQDVSERKESLAQKFQDKATSKSVKRILELLCNEAGFLVEDKLQKLLAPLHKDEQSLMRLDSIFKALGVETVDDIERLTGYFMVDSDLIHPNQVVQAIGKFIDDSKIDEPKQQYIEEENDTATSKVKEMQKSYWNRMELIIPDSNYRTWKSVYKGMEAYNNVLNQRFQLMQDIQSIKSQNEELKALLRQYMSARVNEELQIPPTQIMLAQAGLLRGQQTN